MKPSFIEYLCLNEDAAAELSQLTVQRQQLILKKAAADKLIDQQIANLDRMIYQKERQQQAEEKKNTNQQKVQQPNQQLNQQNNQQNPNMQQRGTQTTTPGSTGAQTPGSGVQQQVN